MRQLKITKSITNRNSASLDKYLQDISREELITAEQEVELARRIKAGDKKALERLTKANLRFVVSVSKQYQNQGLSLPDMINEGNLGLIKAAQKFDETRGFKFISYAVWWIRQSILQAIAEQSRLVRLPLNQVGAINKIKKVTSQLEQQFERVPSESEIAEEMELSSHKIKSTMKIATKYVSMDAPISSDEDTKFLDFFVPQNSESTDEDLEKESLGDEIQRSLELLTDKERDIINMYYGIGLTYSLTLEEIGAQFHLTRERVRQIKEKAIRKLRHTARVRLLKAYLGQ
ncbi:MAG: sigma-70 family RNA polymerase sigma factor [Lentimicrobiaceae bacterium]|jgi:RNA polymerase primary sigma factor|nr:sigma-70 family RNA polymerase sigma factor [Lentimicrobiaceae bacterium]MCP4909656.1 sigma-70 family RNA polymerase sigma factor [Bacteroidota bacterium]MBT3454753.1 sigma-70 family RNA polymerase sigma factor [Lentimicrobiaceae bacterium]MBT3819643.1 sigma-70 family RNA polymerase sigma factor [Lentimicrobiaceae bacterium]MBT4061279.1 sigma-70 family RNA polymerase sigma factor [Lentimicrobiaceae bacterium]